MNKNTYTPMLLEDGIKPELHEAFTDNGAHSHWRLINPDTGDLLWTEDPEEDTHAWVGKVPFTTYAIPPQQKQDDKDLLESLTKLLLPQIGTYPNTLTVGIATDCAKTILKHYNLTKK